MTTRISFLMVGLAAPAMALLAPGEAWAQQQGTISAKASVIRSLVLSKKQDLDFGTVTITGSPGTYTVSINLSGVRSCPAGTTCAGTPLQGIMNVQGSNNRVVQINVGSASLVNPIDGSSIAYTPLAPASVTLTNSGAPGTDFNIGGSIDIPSTADGSYAGNVQVTVNYQ